MEKIRHDLASMECNANIHVLRHLNACGFLKSRNMTFEAGLRSIQGLKKRRLDVLSQLDELGLKYCKYYIYDMIQQFYHHAYVATQFLQYGLITCAMYQLESSLQILARSIESQIKTQLRLVRKRGLSHAQA